MDNNLNTKRLLKELLNPEIVKNNLSLISLYIMIFELLKDTIEKNVDDFFLIEYKEDNQGNKKKETNDNYKKNVLSLLDPKDNKNYYIKASLRWLQEANILDKEDEQIYNNLRKYRNELTHEFFMYIIENKEICKINMKLLIDLFTKLEKKWIIEIEIPLNPDYDKKIIEEEDVDSYKLLTLDLIHDIALADKDD